MINFNSLYITALADYLNIDISVEDLSYYTGVYISDIYIDNQDTFSETSQSATPAYHYSVSGSQKSLKLSIPSTSILANLKNDLIFVWIVMKGSVSSGTPCGMDSMSIVKAVYNQRRIADFQLPYINEVCNSSCCIPKNLIDVILQKEALDMALSTSNNIAAIKLWSKFFTDTNLSITPMCNCHG